ncbi:sugar ABC transporter permease [Cohnella faecalis]|uniref:Sugar ABC transporter permease n=1 Tax=Cohnella faecalis TaxID=2315694 RepID=A0A398CGX5_9BACL|nr:sugar ABC transporter permease [Cohnella faecalis]
MRNNGKIFEPQVVYNGVPIAGISGLRLYGIAPIGWSAVYSFYEWDGISPMKFTGFDNYIRMFTEDDVFWQVFKNNIVFTIVNVVFQVSVGLFIAVLLTKIKRAARFFRRSISRRWFFPRLRSFKSFRTSFPSIR